MNADLVDMIGALGRDREYVGAKSNDDRRTTQLIDALAELDSDAFLELEIFATTLRQRAVDAKATKATLIYELASLGWKTALDMIEQRIQIERGLA